MEIRINPLAGIPDRHKVLLLQIAGWSSLVARQAHNLKAAGSNPAPATNPAMRYRVYVIQNPQQRFYVGLSDDVDRRLHDHNSGLSKWTRNRGPWKLVWTSEAMSRSDARKLENRPKRQGRGSGFYRITGLTRTSSS